MTLQLKVPDMACSACVETITQAVLALDPSAQVSTDLQTKQVQIESQHTEASLREAIVAAGYTIA
jgi:copper chaperone